MSINIKDLLNSTYVETTTAPQLVTYSIEPNTTNLPNGSTVTFTISTQGVADGTDLYWTNDGTTVAEDFVDFETSGIVTISGNSSLIELTLNDTLVSPTGKTIIIILRTDSPAGQVVASSTIVFVENTNEVVEPSGEVTIGALLGYSEPAPMTLMSSPSSYSVVANAYSLTEGQTVIFNITTVGVDDYTVLYWSNDGTTVAADFTDGIMNGSVTIVDSTAQVERTLTEDILSEGGESIVFTLRGDSVTGPVLAVALTVLIEDSSQSPYPPPPPYPDGEIPIETILGGFATIGYTGSQGGIGYTGSRGIQGYTGSQGRQGAGLVILGSLTDTTELPYPYTGNKGDGYLIGSDLYTWDGDTWNNVGDIHGPIGYTGSQGERGLDQINTANDVDVTDIKDGSVLVYKEDSSKWTSTTLLDKQIFDGGHY